MTLTEIKVWLEEHKDDEDVKNYISASRMSWLKSDEGKTLLTSEDGKKLYQPEIDRIVSKAIDTFREKTMPGLIKDQVEKKVKELHPEETPEQKRIREMNEKIDNLTKENQREKMSKFALQELNSKGLIEFIPVLSLLAGETEEDTKTKIAILEDSYKKKFEKDLKEKLPGREINQNQTGLNVDLKDENPWKKENWNLTKQNILDLKEPEKAKRMREAAGVKS